MAKREEVLVEETWGLSAVVQPSSLASDPQKPLDADKCVFNPSKGRGGSAYPRPRLRPRPRPRPASKAVSSPWLSGHIFDIDLLMVPKQSRDKVIILMAEKVAPECGGSCGGLSAGDSLDNLPANTNVYVEQPIEANVESVEANDESVETNDEGEIGSAAPQVSISTTTHPWRMCISAFMLVRIAAIFSITGRLRTNPYASDQTLLDHAAQLYTVHVSIPLLATHVLPTLAFSRMFQVKEDAALQTAQAVNLKHYYPCPMTEEQASQLGLSLHRLHGSMLQLHYSVSLNLTGTLRHVPKTLLHLSDRPMQQLGDAILLTRNRSHTQEIFISANELFDILNGWEFQIRGINSYGLKALEEYSVDLERSVKEVLPYLEDSLSLLLTAYDHYDDVFKVLHNIGLSHCQKNLEQSLSITDGQEREGEEGHKPSGWGACLRNWRGKPRYPVRPKSTSVSFSWQGHTYGRKRSPQWPTLFSLDYSTTGQSTLSSTRSVATTSSSIKTLIPPFPPASSGRLSVPPMTAHPFANLPDRDDAKRCNYPSKKTIPLSAWLGVSETGLSCWSRLTHGLGHMIQRPTLLYYLFPLGFHVLVD
ncbi:MAG: hypothetical protein Q9225_005620 [Loekoesia sp. 1 TL-2023]